MANKKKIASNSKTSGAKYAKLMKAASKELADKKKALAKAEKTLAAATKSHSELLQETARLDMLERSLKALVEGTEPPQNVRYVYTYPQWVWTNQWWQGNPYGWWWNGNTWTVNLGQSQVYPQAYSGNYSNAQSGQFTTANTVQTTTAGALVSSSTSGFIDSSLSGLSNCSLSDASSSAFSSSPSFTMTTTNGPSSSAGQQPELTVDLSTGAAEEDVKSALSAEEIMPFLDLPEPVTK